MVGQFQALSDGRAREAFHEEGPQGLIAAVQGLRGLEEELTAERIIHDGTPELRVTFGGRQRRIVLHGLAELPVQLLREVATRLYFKHRSASDGSLAEEMVQPSRARMAETGVESHPQ